MTTTQRHVSGAIAVGLVVLLSWLTILPGTPRIYAPLNYLVMLPAFLVSSERVAVVVVPVFFCVWSWPVLRGDSRLPTRSIVLLVLSIALSAASLVVGYRYGIRYQGLDYVVGVAVVNLLCWALLSALAFIARRHPSFGNNLGFHTALFAWLAWCAFPYMGELP